MKTTNTPPADWLTRWTCRVNWLDWASHPETRHVQAAMQSVRREREQQARVRRHAVNFILQHRHA